MFELAGANFGLRHLRIGLFHLLIGVGDRLSRFFFGVLFLDIGRHGLASGGRGVADELDREQAAGDQRQGERHRRAVRDFQPAFPAGAFDAASLEFRDERLVLRIGGIEQRQAEVEILLVERGLRVALPGFEEAGAGSGVASPHVEGLFIPELRAGEVGVVLRLDGFLKVLVGACGECDALGVRSVTADRALELPDRRIAVFRPRGHRPHGDVEKFSLMLRLGRGDKVALHHVVQIFADAGPAGQLAARLRMRGLAGDDFVERGPEQVDVGRRRQVFDRPDHLRRHVGRRAPEAARPAQGGVFRERRRRERQSPVHEHHDAEVAEHDVLGLDVAVDDSAGMGESDGVRDFQQDFEVLVERVLREHVPPGMPFDALHRVEGSAVIRPADVVNRHDVGVVERPGDQRFRQELVAALLLGGRQAIARFELRAVGRRERLDDLERDHPVERGLLGQVDRSHAAFAEHLADEVIGRLVGAVLGEPDLPRLQQHLPFHAAGELERDRLRSRLPARHRQVGFDALPLAFLQRRNVDGPGSVVPHGRDQRRIAGAGPGDGVGDRVVDVDHVRDERPRPVAGRELGGLRMPAVPFASGRGVLVARFERHLHRRVDALHRGARSLIRQGRFRGDLRRKIVRREIHRGLEDAVASGGAWCGVVPIQRHVDGPVRAVFRSIARLFGSVGRHRG